MDYCCTTGAIASIAFGNREPLVDGNVIRVMARMRAVGADPKNKQLVKFSWKTASELVSECDRPGALNQALMELGATICTVQVMHRFLLPQLLFAGTSVFIRDCVCSRILNASAALSSRCVLHWKTQMLSSSSAKVLPLPRYLLTNVRSVTTRVLQSGTAI